MTSHSQGRVTKNTTDLKATCKDMKSDVNNEDCLFNYSIKKKHVKNLNCFFNSKNFELKTELKAETPRDDNQK